MNAAWQSCVWVEWRERRGALAAALGAMALLAWYVDALGARSFYDVSFAFGIVAAVFLALRTAQGETADGTRTFTQALPAPRGPRAALRLLSGALVIVAAIGLAAVIFALALATGWTEFTPRPGAVVALQWQNHEPLPFGLAVQQLGFLAALAMSSSTTLYLLLSLLGTRLDSPWRLGFVGSAAALLWGMAIMTKPVLQALGLSWLADWSGALAPQSIYIDEFFADTVDGVHGSQVVWTLVFAQLAVNVLWQLGLAILFVRSYGRQFAGRASREMLPRRAGSVFRTLPPATRPWALAWLAGRQAIPLAVPGLVIALLFAGGAVAINRSFGQDGALSDHLADAMQLVGMLWPVVVGAGLFADEAAGRVREFWRSRPIPPSWFFGVKFVVGLAAVLLTLDGAVIVAGWNSPRFGDYHALSWAYIACYPPMHAAYYSLAVAMTCLVRRPGFAAVATLLLLMIVTPVIVSHGGSWYPDALHRATWPGARPELYQRARDAYPLVQVAVWGIVMGCAVVASKALGRQDAGRWFGKRLGLLR